MNITKAAICQGAQKFWWKYRPYIIGALVALLGAFILAFLLHKAQPPPQPIATMSQQAAETPQGVATAALAAQVPLSLQQAQEAAQGIQEAKNRLPDRVASATGATVMDVAKNEMNKSHADFAILTDPKHPSQTPAILNKETAGASLSYKQDVLSNEKTNMNQAIQLEGVQPGDPVVLNQYNIQAYPERLTTFHIGIYSAGIAPLHKAKLPAIPLILPKGAVGYIGPYVGVEHEQFERIKRVDFGVAGAF